MIKKILFTTLLLVAAHFLFVKYYRVRWQTSQHQWQDNVIRAQRMIYSEKAVPNYIVGSSISYRLVMDSLPDTYNLAFNGQTLYDGMEILCNTRMPMKHVFVEMNMVLRKEDGNFTSSLNSPLLYNARKVLPSLRDEYQPVGIVGGYLAARVTGRVLSRFRGLLPKPAENERPGGENGSNKLFDEILQDQVKLYAVAPDKNLLDEQFSKLQHYVALLQKKGVTVHFFEMPMDKHLCGLAKATAIREAFHKQFPEDRFHYLPTPDCTGYATTDAIHLDEESAVKFTSYFRKYASVYR
jgi:hypothetical protein